MVSNYFLCKISLKFNIISILKKHNTAIRVRYAETDQMQVVYHGNYAQYFEIGRTEWLRSLDITYKTMEANGVMLPVISLTSKFIKSALYDDLLTITTILKKAPGVKMEFDYEVTNQNNELICTGNSILVFMNSKTKKPMRCPEYILKKLEL